ncbi:cilia- and flagella-associated protein 251-like isoform X2 [Phoenix dactylifera]|uniref:Cilia- and flagella-associated protein 251-like isoform X2 n=1 Tax=Phoenix dactylifera TaxID=42345 RepID=A0A8B9AJZ0_PHODC|nr:cilia- and flagella-associated protein 251-like isoform X2 [Phoenix dactylifera]
MVSETLEEEKKSSEDGSPPVEGEAARDPAEEEAAAGGEASREAEKGVEEEEEEEEGEKKVEEEKRKRKRRDAVEKGEEEGTEKKERKRRSTAREPATPVERPSRERKAVERYTALSPRRTSATKVLAIEQGAGIKLKDIPNVLFKLSKRKVDENLQILHTILFGRKSNVHFLKRNILQFSGIVWADNKEKQRAKIKEKLDKCNKEKLLDFCELLDLHVLKATAKKEEISAKLLEFLESPYVTRDVVLTEKEKGKKRKRRTKGIHQTSGEASSDWATKKRRKSRKQSAKPEKEEDVEDEDEDKGGSTDVKDASTDDDDQGDSEEECEHAKSDQDEEEDEPGEPAPAKKGSGEKQTKKWKGPKMAEKVPPVKKGSHANSNKTTSKSVANKEGEAPVESKKDSKESTKKGLKASTKEKSATLKKNSFTKSTSESSLGKHTIDDNESGPPLASKSKKENKRIGQSKEIPATADNASKKQAAKSQPKVFAKKQGKTKASKESSREPSTEELHAVVSDILKEVDFNTATLADILRQLGSHFNTDLMNRKAEVKHIIEDVINSMSDDEDGGEDEDGAGDAEGEVAKEESDGDGDK